MWVSDIPGGPADHWAISIKLGLKEYPPPSLSGTRCFLGPMGHFAVGYDLSNFRVLYSKMAHGGKRTPGDSEHLRSCTS